MPARRKEREMKTPCPMRKMPHPQGAKVAKALRLGSALGQRSSPNPLLQFLYKAGPRRYAYSLDVLFPSVRREQL